MNFRPLADRVLVQRTDIKPLSVIIKPDDAHEKSQWATVVAVGPGKYNANNGLMPMSVKVGDIVYLSRFGGTEVKIDDQDYLILNDVEILGIKE